MGPKTIADYYNILYQYQSAQLLYEAIKLDIFSFTDSPVTSKELSAATGYNERNLELFLLALSSCGHLVKDGDNYRNTKSSAEYLSKASPHYIGEAIIFRETMTSLCGIGEKIRRGTGTQLRYNYDFAALARVTVPEMYATGRVKAFLAEVNSIFPEPSHGLRMLDLGGGSGILAIEFAKHYPNSQAYVFEHPSVAQTTKEIIAEHAAQKRVSVLSGDFNTDDLGACYDLVVASGILDFAAGDLSLFIEKIANSLSENGYLLLVGRYSETGGYPQKNILSWLSGYMNGIAPPPTKKRVEAALSKARLSFVHGVDSGRFQGDLYQKEALHE